MKNLLAGIAGIVMAVSLTACSGGDAEPTATETVTVAPETTAPSEPSYSSEPAVPETPAVNMDEEFANLVRENVPTLAASPTADIVDLSETICSQFDQGNSIEDVLTVLLNNNLPDYESGFLVGAAVSYSCPEYESMVDQFIANNSNSGA